MLIELHQSFLDNPPAYAGVQPAPVCNLLIGNINQVRTCNGQAVGFRKLARRRFVCMHTVHNCFDVILSKRP